jgi:hypothetical protein
MHIDQGTLILYCTNDLIWNQTKGENNTFQILSIMNEMTGTTNEREEFQF